MILREVASLVKVSFLTLYARLRYARRYWRGRTPWDTGRTPPELLDFLASQAPGRALEMGCGTGTNAIALAQHGWEVHAIDFSSLALRIARRKARRAGVQVHFHHRSVTNTKGLPAPFDLLLDIGCYHGLHPVLQARYAANLPRLLSANGILLMYAHLRYPGASQRYGLDERGLRLLQEHMRIVQRSEGVGHRGRPAIWLTLQRRALSSSRPPTMR